MSIPSKDFLLKQMIVVRNVYKLDTELIEKVMDIVEPSTFLTKKKAVKQEEEIRDQTKFIRINDRLIAFQPDLHILSKFIMN